MHMSNLDISLMSHKVLYFKQSKNETLQQDRNHLNELEAELHQLNEKYNGQGWQIITPMK